MIKVLSTAAMVAALATSSFAGNLNAVETAAVDNVFVETPGSNKFILPVVACLILCTAVIASSGGGDSAATTTTPAGD